MRVGGRCVRGGTGLVRKISFSTACSFPYDFGLGSSSARSQTLLLMIPRRRDRSSTVLRSPVPQAPSEDFQFRSVPYPGSGLEKLWFDFS